MPLSRCNYGPKKLGQGQKLCKGYIYMYHITSCMLLAKLLLGAGWYKLLLNTIGHFSYVMRKSELVLRKYYSNSITFSDFYISIIAEL